VGADAVVARFDAHEPGVLAGGLRAAGVPGREGLQPPGEPSSELRAAEVLDPVEARLLQLRPGHAQSITDVEGFALDAVGGHDGGGEQRGGVLHRGHVAVVQVPGGVRVEGGGQVLGQRLRLGDAVVGGAVPDAQRRTQFTGEDLLAAQLHRIGGISVRGFEAGMLYDAAPAEFLHSVQTEGVHPRPLPVEGHEEVGQRGVPGTREGAGIGQRGRFEHAYESTRTVAAQPESLL